MPFYYYTPSDDSDEGNTSESVLDAWSEVEDDESQRRVSKEAQEAAIQEHFKKAVEALRLCNQQKSLRILTDIFLSAPMQQFHVVNWRDFNWTAAEEKSQRTLSNMAKIYFSVCLALAGLVENSVTFYMQALSIYPKLTDVWFTCGRAASKCGDWTTGAFCFERCGDEFRAYEALLLLHYIGDELHKCVQYIDKIFERCKDHHLAHVLSDEIARRDPLLKDAIARLPAFQPLSVPDRVKSEILNKINEFRSTRSKESKRDDLMELITASKRPYAPLELVLRRDMSMTDIGRALCDAFLRIETFSLLAQQSVHVTEFVAIDERPISTLDAESAVNDEDGVVDSDYEMIVDDAADDTAPLAEERAVLNEMLESVCIADSEREEEAKRRRLQKKKSAQQRKTSTKSSGKSCSDASAVCPSTADDELMRRRSTRFVEDVEMSAADDVVDKTFWTNMSVDDESVDKMAPFAFASSSEAGLNVFANEFVMSATPLPSFEPLVARLLSRLSESATTIERLLADFLQFCAADDGECGGCVFSEEQAQTFRQVYTCWCRAFTDNVFTVIPPAELAVHMLAAELGSPLALYVVRSHFPSPMRYVDGSSGGLFADRSRRTLFNRYVWLLYNANAKTLGFLVDAPELIVFRFTSLTLLAQTLDADERISAHFPAASTSGMSDCEAQTGLPDVCAILYEEARKLYARQVDELEEMEDYEELLDILLNQYNFLQDDEETRLSRIFLLVKCATKTDRFYIALSSILAIFQQISNKTFTASVLKRALRRCAAAFDDIDLAEVDPRTLCAFGKAVADLLIRTDNTLLQNCMDVWLMCYRIAKHRENVGAEALAELYAHATDDSFPTKALRILSQAHDAIGRQRKCWKQHGKLLRVFLEEMYAVMSNPTINEQLRRFESAAVTMKRNVTLEAFQCLVCVFSEPLSKIRNHYDDHGNIARFDWECDWHLAEIALPLIMPHVLPEFSSMEKINNYFAEVMTRVFPFVLDVSAETLERLKRFIAAPPTMELREVHDEDGLTSFFSEDYVIEGVDDPRVILYGAHYREKLAVEDDDDTERRRLELTAKCAYAMAIYHYRNNNNEEALRMARVCLAVGGPFLDGGLQSSAWFIYARCVTNDYSMMQDAQLLENVDEFLFPFKMTVFLKKDSCDAHLDMATIIYQIRTRMKRFTKKSVATEEQKRIYNRKIAGMIPKCRTHFELAKRYGDSDAEIPWLSAYFLAKIAEKLGDPSEKVFKLYYDCVVAMENEGYQYPQKINRTKQTNFEPLEIHYKVHTYAYKQLELIKAQSKHALLARSTLDALRSLYANTRRFAFQAVEQKGVSKPEFYVENSAELLVDLEVGRLTSVESFIESTNNVEIGAAVTELMTDLVDYTDMMRGVAELCEQGYETILAKFPHYKSCYRLAESQYKRGEFRRCADTLFYQLFFNAKKRLTMCSNIFENIVEISRADIERSGSFPYHIQKIVDLAVVSSFRSRDIDRLMVILSSLLILKNKENVPDVLDEATLAVLRQKCATGAVSLMAGLKTSQTLSQATFQLSDVIRKLNKENILDEAKLLSEAHRQLTQKRLKLEQQQRIANSQIVQATFSRPPNIAALAKATKRPAADPLPAMTLPKDRNQCVAASPTVPKHPRLTTPSPAAEPKIVAAAAPTTSSSSSSASCHNDDLLANSAAFGAFLNFQMQRLQMPMAERARLFVELQKAAARTDSHTQKALIIKFMEKMCSMTPAFGQATGAQLTDRNAVVQQSSTKSDGNVVAKQQSAGTRNTVIQQTKQTALAQQQTNTSKLNASENVMRTNGNSSKTTSTNQRTTVGQPAVTLANVTKPPNQQQQLTKDIELLLQAAKAKMASSTTAAAQKPKASPQPSQRQLPSVAESDPQPPASQHKPSVVTRPTQSQPSSVAQPTQSQPSQTVNAKPSSKTAPNPTTSAMTVRQHLQQLTQQQQLNKSSLMSANITANASSIQPEKPAKSVSVAQAERELVSKVAASVSEAQHLQLLQLRQQLEAFTKQNATTSYNANDNKMTTTVSAISSNAKPTQQTQQKPIFSPAALFGQATAANSTMNATLAKQSPIVASPQSRAHSLGMVANALSPISVHSLTNLQQLVSTTTISSPSSLLPLSSSARHNYPNNSPTTHNQLVKAQPTAATAVINSINFPPSQKTIRQETIHQQKQQRFTPQFPQQQQQRLNSQVPQQQQHQIFRQDSQKLVSQVSQHQQSTSLALQQLQQRPTPLASQQQQQRPIPPVHQQLQQKAVSNVATNTQLSSQQQYLYNLYLSGLRKENERLNNMRDNLTAASPAQPTNGERPRHDSEDDIIVVGEKSPAVRRITQQSDAPANVGSATAQPLQQPNPQQQMEEWLSKMIAANASSLQQRRQ